MLLWHQQVTSSELLWLLQVHDSTARTPDETWSYIPHHWWLSLGLNPWAYPAPKKFISLLCVDPQFRWPSWKGPVTPYSNSKAEVGGQEALPAAGREKWAILLRKSWAQHPPHRPEGPGILEQIQHRPKCFFVSPIQTVLCPPCFFFVPTHTAFGKEMGVGTRGSLWWKGQLDWHLSRAGPAGFLPEVLSLKVNTIYTSASKEHS